VSAGSLHGVALTARFRGCKLERNQKKARVLLDVETLRNFLRWKQRGTAATAPTARFDVMFSVTSLIGSVLPCA
jgi:hypothetical protein